MVPRVDKVPKMKPWCPLGVLYTLKYPRRSRYPEKVYRLSHADSSDDIFAAQDEQDRKAIGSKWIFKIKCKSSGEINRYKARLVQGFGQKEGIYYKETFSPVVKMVTVRCLLNVDVSNSWPVFQLDANNAFLYGDPVETVYMKPPEGYFPSDNKVCRLKKSLYGLKQAPRQWNAKLTCALIEIVLVKSYLKTAFKILRYLKSCPGLGIHTVKNFAKSRILSLSPQLKQSIEFLLQLPVNVMAAMYKLQSLPFSTTVSINYSNVPNLQT
ncbi:ribonuclease H-like domain-containing protein [Tanacetum coccineum]